MAEGAAFESVSVHAELVLEVNEDGEQFNPVTVNGGASDKVAEADEPLSEAITEAVCANVTAPVDAENDSEETPAATATESGTVRAGLLDKSATEVAETAALESVTVHVALALDASEDGEHWKPLIVSDATSDKFANADDPLSDAVIVAI